MDGMDWERRIPELVAIRFIWHEDGLTMSGMWPTASCFAMLWIKLLCSRYVKVATSAEGWGVGASRMGSKLCRRGE